MDELNIIFFKFLAYKNSYLIHLLLKILIFVEDIFMMLKQICKKSFKT